MSPFPRLPSVFDGPMVARPDLASLPAPAAVTVNIPADVASWFQERGLDIARVTTALLRAHIDAHVAQVRDTR